jgi:para-nitrobenzyl esterase
MDGATRERGADRRTVLAGAAALAASMAAPSALASPADGADFRGNLQDGIHVYRGIPYGLPTGGGARFSAPQPLKPRSGTVDAKHFGDQCPQNSPSLSPQWSSWQANVGESEDCLTLNVWTPAFGDGGKRPVLVWLHGGGFMSGNGAWGYSDGARLAERGDVVVVTLNHRLNVFGYLYLAELGGSDFADSGVVGQLDIIAALEWVRDNIAAFGGDPGRVTIFGEEGGAGKVAALMAMPAAKGLFQRAALQSGGPYLTAVKREDATAAARAVLAAVGVSDKHPDDLRHTPVDRLLGALKSARVTLGPVVDGKNLPHDLLSPEALQISGSVPLIVGYNAAETAMLAPAVALAERKASLDAAGAYLYRLEFEGSAAGQPPMGSLDLPLVFDNVERSTSLLGAAAPDAQKVADQMASAWIALARTGSPNAKGLASWPRYDARARPTMLFNVVSRAVNDPPST